MHTRYDDDITDISLMLYSKAINVMWGETKNRPNIPRKGKGKKAEMSRNFHSYRHCPRRI